MKNQTKTNDKKSVSEEIKKTTYLLVGANGTGKTKILEQIFNFQKKTNENVIFIRCENEINNESIKEKETTFEQIDEFLQKLLTLNIEYKIKDDFSEKEKELKNRIKNFKKNLNKIRFQFSKDNDFILPASISDKKLKINEDKLSQNITHPIYIFDWKKGTAKDKIKCFGGTGQKFYSFLLMVCEFCDLIVNFQKQQQSLSPKNILIIEEPEKFCHPGLINKIAILLREISKKIDLYISTHSPNFLNIFLSPFLKNEKVVRKLLLLSEKNKKNRKISLEDTNPIELFQEENKNISFLFENFDEFLIPLKKKEEEPLKKKEESKKINLLKYSYFSINFFNFLFAKKTIFVEGMADFYLMQKILCEIKKNYSKEKEKEKEKEYNIFIFICGGKYAMIALMKKLFAEKDFFKKEKKNYFWLFDNDEKKTNQKETSEELKSKLSKEYENEFDDQKENNNNFHFFKNDIETDLRNDEVKSSNKTFPYWIFDEKYNENIYKEIKNKIEKFSEIIIEEEKEIVETKTN